MATKALTDKTIEALKSGPKRYEVHDLRCPGLTLRVERSGRKAFYVRFRYGLTQKHPKLGTYPRMSLATAREKANDWLRQVEEGIDPTKRKRSSDTRLRPFAASSSASMHKRVIKVGEKLSASLSASSSRPSGSATFAKSSVLTCWKSWTPP